MDVMSFDNISYDIILEILQYIPLEDLVLSVQFVNKYWQSIIEDPILWRDFKPTFKPTLGMNSADVVKVLKQAPLLRSFEFRYDLNGTEILNALCKYNPNITSLALDHFEADTTIMEKLVETYPDLEFLQLPLSVFMSHIFLLGKLRKLKTLKCTKMFSNTGYDCGRYKKRVLENTDWCALEELELCGNFSDPVFEKMIRLVRGNLKILKIQIVYTGKILEHFQHCVKLEKLELNFMSKIHMIDYEDLFAHLKNLVNLKYLNITLFVHKDVEVLCKLFNKATFSNLAEVYFEHCLNFNHSVARSIVTACPKLQVVGLKGCNSLDDECLQMFSQCTFLTSLDISGSSAVTEIGLSHLKSCHHLSILKLNWIGLVTAPMLEQIAQIKSLSNLHLDNTEVSLTLLENAVTQLPKLKLLSVYNTRGIVAEELQKIVPNCLVRYLKKDVALLLREQANHLQCYNICGVNEEALKVLPKCKTNLEVLSVDFLEQPCFMLSEFFTSLQNLKKLRALSLKGLVEEKGLLNQMLDGLPPLQELKFDHCLCVNEAVAVAITAHCPKLKKLTLKSCMGLDDDGLSAIVKLECLHYLDISGCIALTETGLLCLSECKTLIELNLCGVLSISELIGVLNYILSLPKLRALILEYNKLVEFNMRTKDWVIQEQLNGNTVARYVPFEAP